ncbi:efflux RND transporter periplasmic adaptor subunit [Symbiobacterium thermophilum]|uniref:Multidrug resistance protein MdtA-like C-terminal permuted SH3 domain-containing protein n=1 Tax=Symbiobacterium thermophilum TaxID=2734 RepID=A0A953ID47_SYMTR|nr:efflux RND transporter periplasmic adaptor subunit [Symbiobacterium thermophilum]MBY6276085.1 hypothetical protein [Symbiobacterium thermophilum]
MRRKVIVILLVLAVLGACGWFGYQRFFGGRSAVTVTAMGPEGAPVVQVQRVSRGMLIREIYSPGTVQAGNLQEYKAPLTSPRVTVYVEAGQQIEEGQLLAELDATELQEEVKTKERDLLQAQRDLEELLRQMESAPLQLERNLQEARRQLVEAQSNLARVKAGGGQSSDVERLREQIDQLRSQVAAAQQPVEEARKNLTAAEAAYVANPSDSQAAQAYRAAEEAYREAVRKSQATVQEAAEKLAEAEAELAALLEGSQDGASRELNVRLAEIQVSLAEVAVKEAEEAVRRGPDMGQVELARARVEAAQATLDKLRANLEATRIVAAAPGTVLSVHVKDGDPVQQGASLLRVGDMERMELIGQVEAVDLDSLEPGQPIMVTSSLLPLASFEGTVTRISQQTAQSNDGFYGGPIYYMGDTVTFEVRGEVMNADGRLKSGMSVEMRIQTAQLEDVIVVPLLAVREEAGQAFVLVVHEDYTVEVRPIQTGLVTNREVEVIAGLEEGEMIITSPFGLIQTLQDGDQVQIQTMPGMDPFMGGPMGPGGGRMRTVPGRVRAVPLGLVTGGAAR